MGCLNEKKTQILIAHQKERIVMRVDPEDPERDDVSRLEVVRDDFVDPECDDISRLEGMGDDFVDPEHDDISWLEGMKSRKSILIIT